MSEEEGEFDDDTIQARVDASLAKIYSVTTTWLNPKKTSSTPKKDFEKELEEITRRPPRLGVGAEPPQKPVHSGPSELKLKGKMLGKKREREETNINVVPIKEDGEEETKSRVVQKKPRLDPFASSKKKGKGLNAQTAVISCNPTVTSSSSEIKLEKGESIRTNVKGTPELSSPKTTSTCKRILGGGGSDEEEEEKRLIVNGATELHLQNPPAVLHGSKSSRKRKRRKKKKRHAGGETGAAAQQNSTG